MRWCDFPLTDAAAQVGVPAAAVQGWLGRGSARLHQLGKRAGQFLESAAQDLDVVRIEQVGG